MNLNAWIRNRVGSQAGQGAAAAVGVTTLLLLVALGLPACGNGASSSVRSSDPLAAKTSVARKVGVLMASHGDINDVDTELEDYIKTAFLHNVGIPLPEWIRGPITDPAYRLSVNTVRKQYDIIGPTHYRENAAKQIDAITAALRRLGVPGKAYFGANFAHPYISETLDQMHADGVNTILVFNKGGQFSYASSGENMDDVLEYLNEHKDWDVEAIGRFEYSEELRFREAMAAAIERDLETSFPGIPAKDVCLLIGSHGLPKWLTDKGDPAIRQMNRAVDWLTARFADHKVYHGFLNDDFFPGAKWVKPDSEAIAKKIQDDGCTNVLMDGRLSFTTHHRATLYDLNYIARKILEVPTKVVTSPAEVLSISHKVVLAPNFNDDTGYATLMAELSEEAINREGDIIVLKEFGKEPLPHGSTSKPGVFADSFKRFTWPN